MDGLGTNEDVIIEIIPHRSNKQRQDLKLLYQDKYGRVHVLTHPLTIVCFICKPFYYIFLFSLVIYLIALRSRKLFCCSRHHVLSVPFCCRRAVMPLQHGSAKTKLYLDQTSLVRFKNKCLDVDIGGSIPSKQ